MENKMKLDILQKLKNALIRVNGDTKMEFGHPTSSAQAPFYLKDLKNNLYNIKDDKNHNAIYPKELDDRCKAIRSSAAMIFNLLGQSPITIDGKTYRRPEYEFKCKTLKNSRHPAHLDAVLISEDNTEIIAIEAKLLEWISSSSPKNLSPAYLSEERYLHQETCKTFFEFFNTLIQPDKRVGKDKFAHMLSRYDAIQMTLHTLGLYNVCKARSFSPCYNENEMPFPKELKKLTLSNIVWSYDCDEYHDEENEGIEFVERANKTFAPLFNELSIDFSMSYITFNDFRSQIDFTNDPGRAAYLKRYDI